ncbi:cytoskeleton-associated protein 2-like isoform X2 [Colossoma macropomum]|uniref:cytoskeleton-associated protein 2-like isoform X2 n=1 Tax=Colossoma macropomum TaxID=42526 RepID=UPI0018653E67|nr:cytoskeleton-associated protein 2-like isoform X2 [Colossoma macropomum]
MGTLTDEDASKLSRIELRKQKLAEYLLAKGRFKPPNPKPYLKESAVLKKPPGAMQRSQASGKGKENNAPSETGVKKDVKMRDALTEKNKNTDASKKELRTLSKAPSGTLQHSTLKSTVSKRPMQHCRTHSKGTSTIRNISIKDQQTKTTVHTVFGTHKHSQTVKITRESQIRQAETTHGISSIRAHTNTAKTDQPKKQFVHRKEFCSDKVTSRSQIKCPTAAEPLRNMASSRTEAKAMTEAQTRFPQMSTSKMGVARPWVSHDLGKDCSGTVKINKPLVRNSQAGKGRSKTTWNKSLSQTNEPGKKTGCTVSQITLSTTDKQRLSLSKKGSSTAAVSKTTKLTAADSKNALPRQQCTSAKLPPKPTVHASVPQSFPHQSKDSSNTKGTEQLKTPKSRFNPGTQGVRTVPLDGRKKPSAAQEERLRKLQEWRESRGITYKRPPMPVKPVRRKTTAILPQSYWTTIEQEDEVHGFVCAVDQSLNDCIKLLQQGCPVDQVRDVVTRLPMARKFAKYWIVQVRLMEREGNLDVLPTFEEAVRVVREPVDELRSVVFEILKKKEAEGSCSTPVQKEKEVHSEEEGKSRCDMQTPKPVGALIRGAKGDSSVIKYKITATPGTPFTANRENWSSVPSGPAGARPLRDLSPRPFD